MFYRKLIVQASMATGGGPFEEGVNDQDLPNWSNESVDDRLNNMVWHPIDSVLLTSSIKTLKFFVKQTHFYLLAKVLTDAR